MDARNSTNYGIRKERTFRLDVILTMWHDGYFEPSQNPDMAQGSLEISPTSTGTNHQPFWVVSTKDINDLVFTRAARFIVPLDHLFREAHISNTISPPSLILAFYTAQLFCRLLTYALTSKEQFPYGNWIWLSRWTARSRTHHTRERRERLGLGLNETIQRSGMLWTYCFRKAYPNLVPRNPIQRGFLSQMNVQRLAVFSISIELFLRHFLNQAKNEFDCENIASWSNLYFLNLYRKFKALWGIVESYTDPFHDHFRCVIGRYILVAFNSDSSKDVTTD
ncbi:uncharacterized protein FPRO_16034 [Fusarium proliferatum ET1]|uniref:Uncharacterized protein n=1 Tax=Fusarium proliferatum (strain ET1) TaxID=1227346 RepID=A0A1L7WBI0_FUSPR|nr:uncharacterized protein FPRO_16034 [Fusarium proliferatum ET1]CZR49826.1 uncharacterized protein FPRO_16034 [Fusarium proliferatum ET1]